MLGNYDITGVLGDLCPGYRERYVPFSVPITITPEPATFSLLGAGMTLLAYDRKKKK